MYFVLTEQFPARPNKKNTVVSIPGCLSLPKATSCLLIFPGHFKTLLFSFMENRGIIMSGNNRESFWQRNLDKVGVGGSILAALCCLEFLAALSIVLAIGLGFLINDMVLLPRLILFFIITIRGLILGKRRHQKSHALILGTISSVALLLFIFNMYNKILVYISIAGLISASIFHVRLNMKVLLNSKWVNTVY